MLSGNETSIIRVTAVYKNVRARIYSMQSISVISI